MSFILDALKKSESERQRADAPALYEMKMAPARSGIATWLIALAALLVINVVVLSVVLLRGTHSAAPQTEASNVSSPVAAANAPTSVPPAMPPPLSVAPAPGPAPDAQAADDAAPAVEPPRSGAGTAAQGSAARSGADSGDVPTYEQAASAPGADLPELKLDLHAYSSNPPDRFIFLNMLNLKEGQTSPAGVRVEAITPDGAILSWRGAKFFLHSQ